MEPYYYYDKDSEMCLINNFKPWLTDNGQGDALWRTAIAYIATGDVKYKKGILRAFNHVETIDGYYWQATRFNDGSKYFKDDVSRDQVILAWTALHINEDFEELKSLIKHTKYRLSKRYIMTPTMWLWSRGLIGNKFLGGLSQLFMFGQLSVSVLLNKVIKLLLNWHDIEPTELEALLEKQGEGIRHDVLTSSFKYYLWQVEFPGYALHLAAWQVYTGTNFFKKINKSLIQSDMSKYNHLLKILSGGTVIDEMIEQYQPTEEWAGSSRNNEMSRNRFIPKEMLNGKELDKLILTRMKQHNDKR